jgi:hypothetical protein
MNDDLRVGGGDPNLFRDKGILIESTEHLVFQGEAPLLLPDVRAWHMIDGCAIAMRKLSGTQTGGVGRKYQVIQSNGSGSTWRPPVREQPDAMAPWVPTGEMVDYDVSVNGNTELDPHVVFYSAAEELRDRIAEEGRLLARDISAQGGPTNLAMVTVVHMPIMAMPNVGTGYRLWAQLSQFAVDPGGVVNRDEAYSTDGKVPMDAPNAIELKTLIHTEAALEEMGVIDPYRNITEKAPVPTDALVEAVRRAHRED